MIENIFSKKWIFIIMALLLVLFLREDRMILNVPLLLNILVFVFSFFIILIFLYRYNSVQKGKKKNNMIIDLLGGLILSFFVFIVIKLAINFYIVKSAEGTATEEIKLPIENFVSGRTDLVYFYFKDKRYSLRYSNTGRLSRKQIMDECTLHIVYSKSFCDTYVINRYNIEVK